MHTYTITRIAGDRYNLVLNSTDGDIEFGDEIVGLQSAIDAANNDCWERSDSKPTAINMVNMKDVSVNQFVTIKQNEFDEYEVPTPTEDAPDSIYYTDDKEDAFMTARHHFGILAAIVFGRGTYGEQS